MNSPTASSTCSSMDECSITTATPIAAPTFHTQHEFDNELCLQFASAPGGDAPVYIDGEVASPMMQYRDASFQFTTAPMDRLDDLDNFSLFPSMAKPLQLETLSAIKRPMVGSPQSPSTAVEVPVKEGWDSFFGSAFPSFPSFATPDKIMMTLRAALAVSECSVHIENHWTLRVSWFCVAEEITFSVALSKEKGNANKYEVAFRRDVGDEMVFHQLVECVRARCEEIDAEPLCFAEPTLEPYLDSSEDLKGRRYAIRDTEAMQLINEMNAAMDADTLYEVAKMVKNHCRHHGNRQLFLETNRAGFVRALKWMLVDSEVLARFAAFILLQYARESSDAEKFNMFSSAFERNSVEILLSELEGRERYTACAKATIPMLAEIQRSWIFA